MEDTIQPSPKNGNEASLFAMPALGVYEPEPPGRPRVRLIWEYVEGLDLSRLYEKSQAVGGRAGRDATDPRIMMALWLYATLEGMRNVTKPWIAFKVMAAGAIPPNDAFQYVFQNGADHVLAGMLDFGIAEDVTTANDVLANVQNWTRPWRS